MAKHKKLLCLIILTISLPLLSLGQIQIGNDIDGLLAGDNFGTDVSMSSDGTIFAATAYGSSNANSRLRVFKNIGGVWTLYGTDSNGGNFNGIISYSVSLSADGHTIAVGTFGPSKVFSYDSNTGIWTQKGEDIPNNTGISNFGYSIKLSDDGNTVAIGAPESPIVPEAGTTQVFQFETDTWNQVGNDIDGLIPGEHSGRSIDLSSNGKILAILNDNSTRVYENISNNWTLLGEEILAIGSQGPNRAISLSSDGYILAIGESDFTDGLIQRGRVRVFNYLSNMWNQLGSDIIGEIAYYRTGSSVSLSDSGLILAVGEKGSTSGSTDTGRTRIFQNQLGNWTQIGSSIFGEATEDYSGGSISLSADASTIAIDADKNDGNGIDSGHVRVFDLNPVLSSNDVQNNNILLYPNPAKNSFSIKFEEEIKLNRIDLYNNVGQLMYTTNKRTIDSSKFHAGIYYVEIVTQNQVFIKKIIIR